MAFYYCPRCGPTEVYSKLVTTSESGPFIAGHIGANPNLPMVGVRLNSETSRVAYFSKTCGEEANYFLTPDEARKRDLETRFETVPRACEALVFSPSLLRSATF